MAEQASGRKQLHQSFRRAEPGLVSEMQAMANAAHTHHVEDQHDRDFLAEAWEEHQYTF